MSRPKGAGPAPTREISEGLIEFLSGVARLTMWAGVLATVIGVGFLVYTCMVFSGPSPGSPEQALANIQIFDKFVLAGVLALGVSTTYLFWGEAILSPLQLFGAALLFFSPFILTTAGIATSTGDAKTGPVAAALSSISQGGMIMGLIGLVVMAVDVTIRVRTRAQQGWKLDQMRYGKGVKEEADRHNVFLGKCWQLPFCRKFVRERCPIYHSRRTCWRELTGCMCEEEVIRNAMENKAVPKDALMAATYIPRNMKLTVDQKRERCRSCVIYNEHQKHKYKLAMPVTVLGFAGVYLAGHGPLLTGVGGLIVALDKMIGRATYNRAGGTIQSPAAFQELLLICFLVVLLAYTFKLLEYLFFKLKV